MIRVERQKWVTQIEYSQQSQFLLQLCPRNFEFVFTNFVTKSHEKAGKQTSVNLRNIVNYLQALQKQL